MKISKTFLYLVDGRIDDPFDPEECEGSKKDYCACKYDPRKKVLKIDFWSECDRDYIRERIYKNAGMRKLKKFLKRFKNNENEIFRWQIECYGIAEPWLYK